LKIGINVFALLGEDLFSALQFLCMLPHHQSMATVEEVCMQEWEERLVPYFIDKLLYFFEDLLRKVELESHFLFGYTLFLMHFNS